MISRRDAEMDGGESGMRLAQWASCPPAIRVLLMLRISGAARRVRCMRLAGRVNTPQLPQQWLTASHRSQRVFSARPRRPGPLLRLEVPLPSFDTKLGRSKPEDIPQRRLLLLPTSLIDFYSHSLSIHL